MPEGKQTQTLKERAGEAAVGAIRYVVFIAAAIGGMIAVFYTSQASQDHDRSILRERVRSIETCIELVQDGQCRIQVTVDKQRDDTARIREDVARMSAEQKAIGGKVDDVKVILLRLERGNP